MKPHELRIGNWVNYDDNGLHSSAKLIQIENGEQIDYTNSGVYFPIHITEEWLLKFGFEKVEDINKDTYPDYKKKGMLIHSNVHGNYVLGNYNPICFIKYVHQLQNVYFALTGEELKTK